MDNKVYFGFAIADGMFPPTCEVTRQPLTVEQVKGKVKQGVTPILNPFHAATIAAMQKRFGIEVDIPERPPRVTLQKGDKVIVMSVRGLPRLTDRREYTDEEIASATFAFGEWTVVG